MKPMVKNLLLLIAAVLFFGLNTSAWAGDGGFRNGPDGLRIKDLKKGQGPEAVAGQVATIHFVGWIDKQGARGKEIFNSRRQHGGPVSFVIGTEGVMDAWNEGVTGMKQGVKRMLLVPSSMAWGGRKVDAAVPANTAMMFHLELINLEDLPES